MARRPTQRAPRTTSTETSSRPKRTEVQREAASVLLVDDDESVRVTLAALLTQIGLRVTECSSGLEAIAQLRRTEFDIMLADLLLEDMDGVGVLREAQRMWPDTIVLVLTGFASVESAVEALRAGAYDYLCKPCPADDLIATVARAIERRRLRIQLRRQTRDLETAIETVCTELRKSLITITGLVDMLIARVEGRDPQILASLEHIRSEARGLAQRVTDTLNLARDESVLEPSAAVRLDRLEQSFASMFASEPTGGVVPQLVNS